MNEHPATTLLNTLFAPGDWVELRSLISGKSPGQQWVQIGTSDLSQAWADLAADTQRSHYFGANPRRESGGRNAQDVPFARCVFADFDPEGDGETAYANPITVAEAQVRIDEAGLPYPTAIVRTPKGVHAYWRLEEPISDLAAWTKMQKAIIQAVGSDGCVHDAPRVMRLPGFACRKPLAEGRVTELVEVDAERIYGLEEFPSTPMHAASDTPRLPLDVLVPLADGREVPEHTRWVLEQATTEQLHRGKAKGRRPELYHQAVHLAQLGWSLPDVQQKIRQAAERLGLSGVELADLVDRQVPNAISYAERGAAVSRTSVSTAKAMLPKRTESITGRPMIVRLQDVKPEAVAWLWPGRIALGKLTLIAGDPGLGKSFLTLDMAARVSSGRGWPDAPEVAIAPGGVVLLSAEDGVSDTIRPRLDAAGADVSRIVALEAVQSVGDHGRESIRSFDLSRDLPALEAAILEVGACKLVVIDPVTAYLGGVDSHNNAEIRGLLAPLGAIAERHRVAMVAVTHLNKSGGGPAIYRAMGSLAFAAAARAAWAVSKDKGDPRRRLLLPIKNNIAPDTGGLAYRIEPLGVDGCPAVAWEPDAVNESADDALSGDREGDDRRTERDDAADWLATLLAHAPRPVRDIERDARDAGYSWATVKRAKAAIGVEARKPGFDAPWEWTLRTQAQDAHPPKVLTEDAHSPPSEHLGREQTGIDENASKMLNGQAVSALGDQ